jgi:integrase
MLTFQEVSAQWLKLNSANTIDYDLLFSKIGSIEMEYLTSEILTDCLIALYDNAKLRGAVFTSYRKFIGEICQFAFDKGYLREMPKIELRSSPTPNLFNKPDSSAMQLLLSHEDCTPAGTILRLAWFCGLLRNEITFLLWNQVDFEGNQLVLTDRKIPLSDQMLSYLHRLHRENSQYSQYVLISSRKTAPMAEQSVSAIVRKALDNAKQNNVRLNDLRIDFIIRALHENSREYVSYISGVDLPALQEHYLPYIDDGVVRENEKAEITQRIRADLEGFLKKEASSMVGLSVRFVWLLGIPVAILPLLTWQLVDFESSTAVFEDRKVSIPEDFLQILRVVKTARDGVYPYIILNDTKRNPTDAFFIQKAVQQALIRSGIMGITLPDLQIDYWRQHSSELRKLFKRNPETSAELYSIPRNLPSELIQPPEDELIEYLKANVSADYKTLKGALNFSEAETKLLLKKCLSCGKIVRVGFRYYLPDSIVPREKQKATLLQFVASNQPVTSSELSALMGFQERRAIYWVINPLLKSNELVRCGRNKYALPDYAPVLVTA